MAALNGINTEDNKSEDMLNHNYDLAKRTYLIGSKKEFTCDEEADNDLTLDESLARAKLSTEEQKALALQTTGFFQSHYGVKFSNFSFSNFSQTSFEAAQPENLNVTEEAVLQYGIIKCDGSQCLSNGQFHICEIHRNQKLLIITFQEMLKWQSMQSL